MYSNVYGIRVWSLREMYENLTLSMRVEDSKKIKGKVWVEKSVWRRDSLSYPL